MFCLRGGRCASRRARGLHGQGDRGEWACITSSERRAWMIDFHLKSKKIEGRGELLNLLTVCSGVGQMRQDPREGLAAS